MTFKNILNKYPDTHSVTFELDSLGKPTYVIYEIRSTDEKNLPDWGEMVVKRQNGLSTNFVTMVREKLPQIKKGISGGK